MAQYTANSITVDAYQWQWPLVLPAPQWVEDAITSGKLARNGSNCRVVTIAGVLLARPGWWLVQDPSGEISVVSPDLFTNNYQVV